MRPRLLDLPGDNYCLIDETDWPIVQHLTLYVGTNGYVYFSRWENGRSTGYTLHGHLLGPHPGMHIDHINGDKLDNRRVNLRVVTPQGNQVNRIRLNRNNTSGVRGVQYTSLSATNPWRAQIMVNHKAIHLGLFATREEAVGARRAAELGHYGELCP